MRIVICKRCKHEHRCTAMSASEAAKERWKKGMRKLAMEAIPTAVVPELITGEKLPRIKELRRRAATFMDRPPEIEELASRQKTEAAKEIAAMRFLKQSEKRK